MTVYPSKDCGALFRYCHSDFVVGCTRGAGRGELRAQMFLRMGHGSSTCRWRRAPPYITSMLGRAVTPFVFRLPSTVPLGRRSDLHPWWMAATLCGSHPSEPLGGSPRVEGLHLGLRLRGALPVWGRCFSWPDIWCNFTDEDLYSIPRCTSPTIPLLPCTFEESAAYSSDGSLRPPLWASIFAAGIIGAGLQAFLPWAMASQFTFPFVEDLVNRFPLDLYARWRFELGYSTEGGSAPHLASNRSRQRQRNAEGQLVGAISHSAALPPLIPLLSWHRMTISSWLCIGGVDPCPLRDCPLSTTTWCLQPPSRLGLVLPYASCEDRLSLHCGNYRGDGSQCLSSFESSRQQPSAKSQPSVMLDSQPGSSFWSTGAILCYLTGWLQDLVNSNPINLYTHWRVHAGRAPPCPSAQAAASMVGLCFCGNGLWLASLLGLTAFPEDDRCTGRGARVASKPCLCWSWRSCMLIVCQLRGGDPHGRRCDLHPWWLHPTLMNSHHVKQIHAPVVLVAWVARRNIGMRLWSAWDLRGGHPCRFGIWLNIGW